MDEAERQRAIARMYKGKKPKGCFVDIPAAYVDIVAEKHHTTVLRGEHGYFRGRQRVDYPSTDSTKALQMNRECCGKKPFLFKGQIIGRLPRGINRKPKKVRVYFKKCPRKSGSKGSKASKK